MKNAPVRTLVVLAILTLFGIVSTQLYWLNKAIEQQDQVFNHNVHVALRNVVESLCEAKGKDYPIINPIEQVSSNYYIVRTNDQIDLPNLEYLLTAEIRERAITQDFEYGVYDCQSNQMVFAENVNLAVSQPKSSLPTLANEEYYFGIYFPDKSRSLIAGMDLWKFTTVLTIVVMLFFGYALIVILRQKRLSEIQKDFINNVTHELKTPLATLSLASATLSSKMGDDGNKYLEIIQYEITRLKHHVDDILQASLSETRRTLNKEFLQIDTFIHDLVDQLKKEYAAQMVDWEVELQPTQPLYSHQLTIENCIRNLVENAIKYGGRRIKIATSQNKEKTLISITDDGIGIQKMYQKKIFDQFYRIPQGLNRHDTKGFGLGLYIVKSSLRKLKGHIEVFSEENKGSTFTITLPNG